MKLILTHEVSNLGEPGDIVDVKDGYGRNYLLPRQFAIRWTKGAAKQVESIKAGRDARAVHDLEEAQQIKGRLEAEPVNVRCARRRRRTPLRCRHGLRHRRGARRAIGASVDKRRIEIGNPIKSLGAHDVAVRVHPEVSATVRLNVVASK